MQNCSIATEPSDTPLDVLSRFFELLEPKLQPLLVWIILGSPWQTDQAAGHCPQPLLQGWAVIEIEKTLGNVYTGNRGRSQLGDLRRARARPRLRPIGGSGRLAHSKCNG